MICTYMYINMSAFPFSEACHWEVKPPDNSSKQELPVISVTPKLFCRLQVTLTLASYTCAMTIKGRKSRTLNAKSSNSQHAAKRVLKRPSASAIADSIANVYEYEEGSGRNRRAKVTLDTTREESSAIALDNDSDDDLAKLKERLVNIVQGDGVSIDVDEDEDIDSDAAFEDFDDERFAEFRFKSNKVWFISLRSLAYSDHTFSPTEEERITKNQTKPNCHSAIYC